MQDALGLTAFRTAIAAPRYVYRMAVKTAAHECSEVDENQVKYEIKNRVIETLRVRLRMADATSLFD